MDNQTIDWNYMLNQKAFWRSYFRGEDWIEVVELWLKEMGLFKPYDPETEDVEDSELPEEIGLTIEMQKGFEFAWVFCPTSGANEHSLNLIHPNAGKVRIGWMDGHFHLDTFRWEEYQLIVNSMKKNWHSTINFQHFACLLMMYVGFTPNNNATILAQVKETFMVTNAFTEEESQEIAESCLDSHGRDCKWEMDKEKGWVFSGGYSTRDKELGEKAVFKAVKDFLNHLE